MRKIGLLILLLAGLCALVFSTEEKVNASYKPVDVHIANKVAVVPEQPAAGGTASSPEPLTSSQSLRIDQNSEDTSTKKWQGPGADFDWERALGCYDAVYLRYFDVIGPVTSGMMDSDIGNCFHSHEMADATDLWRRYREYLDAVAELDDNIRIRNADDHRHSREMKNEVRSRVFDGLEPPSIVAQDQKTDAILEQVIKALGDGAGRSEMDLAIRHLCNEQFLCVKRVSRTMKWAGG